MAIKPRKMLKERQVLDPSIIDFLLHGDCEKGTEAWSLNIQRFFESDCIQKVWAAYRKELMADWIIKNPCSRPFCWWKFDAPKEPVGGWDHERFNSPQRLRLGGIGTPLHHVSCSWGGVDRGIPNSWITEDCKKAGFRGVAIDPNNPPLYESEGAYLKRHEILTGPEKTYLKKHSELMEPEVIEFEE